MAWEASDFWADGTKLALLEELASEKLYTSSELSQKLGCTRNMIISKCAREDIRLLPQREASISMQPQRVATMAATRQAKLASKPLPEPPIAPDLSKAVPMEKLHDAICRYPYGTEPPYTFCGHPVKSGAPYCHAHAQICFQKPLARLR